MDTRAPSSCRRSSGCSAWRSSFSSRSSGAWPTGERLPGLGGRTRACDGGHSHDAVLRGHGRRTAHWIAPGAALLGLSLLLAAIGVALAGSYSFWLAPAPALSLSRSLSHGLGIANFYPLTVAAATGAAPHLVDQAAARLAVAGGLALLTAPLAVGALSDAAGMRWGFGIVAPLLVLAFANLCFRPGGSPGRTRR
jgi:MFS family permease